MYITQARHDFILRLVDWGTQRSPFINPCWVFYSSTSMRQEQDHVLCLWDPWSPVNIVHLFTHDQPVASFYPSNTKVPFCPVLMYCITCTCILLCFLGALAQAFFFGQPTQGSYWCLNIHLVSCNFTYKIIGTENVCIATIVSADRVCNLYLVACSKKWYTLMLLRRWPWWGTCFDYKKCAPCQFYWHPK